ncbi:MAG: serine hydrolase domain-containing protein [Pseudomonadota bacterium]
MNRLQHLLIGVSLVLAVETASGDFSPAEPPTVDAANVASFFDAALTTQTHDHEIVGAVVSVVKDGELLFKRGYGFSDLEARVPADPDRSLFRVASVTKTFIWTAMMQLRESGQLDLEADISEYIDFEIPATHEEPIRVWHLMTHTAGFEERAIGMSTRSLESLPTLRDYLVTLMPERVWAPGLYAGYSNYSSALAGYIVQEVSGQPWSDYVDEQILAPLDMTSTNTHASIPDELLARHAASYRYSGGQFVRMELQYMKATPAGVISTTADDMARYMIAHLNGGSYGEERILTEESVGKLQSALFSPVPGLPPMLHGFFADEQNGQFIVGHSGDINQFHSALRLLPEHNLGVFVSFNSDPASRARSNIFPAFVDHFFPSNTWQSQKPQVILTPVSMWVNTSRCGRTDPASSGLAS